MYSLRKNICSLLPAVIAMPLLIGVSLDASAGQRAVQRAGMNGNSIQRSALRNHESGTYTSNTTRTGVNGGVSTRSTTGVLDKEAGTWTRDTVNTGPNGKTITVHAEVVKTDDGHSRNVTRVGPNGQAASRSTDVVKTDDGRERSTTVTRPDGKTATADTTISVDKDNNTVTRTSNATGFNGKTSSSTTTKTYTPTP